MNFTFISVIVFICCVKQIVSENDHIKAVKEFKSKVNANVYDRDIAPNLGVNSPVDVGLSMYIIDYKINTKEKELTTNMYLRQKWSDDRLKHSYPDIKVVGGKSFIEQVWTPDTFLTNAESVSTISLPSPTLFCSISHNGTVFISHKLQITQKCYEVNHTLECPFEFESYGYSKKDIDFYWINGNKSVGINPQPLGSGGYKLIGNTLDKQVEKLSSGEYARLTMKLKFERANL